MTGSTRSSSGLDDRRKRLLFRCWHRGTRERDLILGRFADAELAGALEFLAPDLPVMQFPAWDCQPYDRVSPHGGILAQRLTTLARLARLKGSDKPLIVLTTVNAVVQRVPAREVVAAQALSVAPGHVVPMDSIVAWLEHNGYNRSSTVREPAEYAVRGGILELVPAGVVIHV